MKKRTCLIFIEICFGMVLWMISPVFANSAQTQWTGTDSTGAIILEEDCPLWVEKEDLTFDIHEFPKAYYQEPDDFNAYSSKVSAEYTFYNPTDYTVSATLVFPFGTIADYGICPELMNEDIEKYDITVDNQIVDKKIRHTLTSYGQQFELERDLAKLQEGFGNDEFYYPEQSVICYTFQAKNVDIKTHPAATAAFFLKENDETKIYMENQSGGSVNEEGILLTTWVDLKQAFSVYVIGAPLNENIDWKFYHNGACDEEIEGTMELIATENYTLKDFALLKYQEDSGVLDYDWYNAVVTSLKINEWTASAFDCSNIYLDVSNQLMRWYQYEITLEPKQRIVNIVTAPIYPAINKNDKPATYQYTYLLSPAKTWQSFKNLDIVINTPYFMIENSLEDFKKVDTSYQFYSVDLPNGELIFTLCEVENPQISSSHTNNWIGIGVGVAVILIGVLCIIKKRKH